MPDSITITGKIGPGLTATAINYPDVRSVSFLLSQKVLRITLQSGLNVDYDISAYTTVTYTVAAGVGTIAVS